MRRVARPILLRLGGAWRGLSSQPPAHDHPTTASSTDGRIGQGSSDRSTTATGFATGGHRTCTCVSSGSARSSSLAGESEWVRNVRAAAGRVVVGRKERHTATLVEVPPQERAPVIRAYLLRAGRHAGSKAAANEARYYFGVSADPSLQEIQPVVEHYPVFRIVEDDGPSA